MKRWIFLFIVALVFFANRSGVNKSADEHKVKPTPVNTKSSLPLTTFVTRKYPAVPVQPVMRNPASVIHQNRRPQSAVKVSLGQNPLRIGKNFNHVENLATIAATAYKPEFGKKIAEDGKFVFFEATAAPADAWPVAQNATTNRLFPISHVLHIKGIDATERDQLKAEGMQEYYYHSRLKFISLSTTPSTVLQQFHSLTKRGFDVRLEVLKDAPQSK